MPNPTDNEKLSFWVSRNLADAVRQKLLDHKRATRERITITDICTDALKRFVEDEQAVREYVAKQN